MGNASGKLGERGVVQGNCGRAASHGFQHGHTKAFVRRWINEKIGGVIHEDHFVVVRIPQNDHFGVHAKFRDYSAEWRRAGQVRAYNKEFVLETLLVLKLRKRTDERRKIASFGRFSHVGDVWNIFAEEAASPIGEGGTILQRAELLRVHPIRDYVNSFSRQMIKVHHVLLAELTDRRYARGSPRAAAIPCPGF